MNTGALHYGIALASRIWDFLLYISIGVAVDTKSNIAKGTNSKKKRPKSDKVRFIFGRDMSVDGMIGALKKMAEDIGMEFVPEKTEKDQRHKERAERR